jgi:uncharacterized protein
MESSKHMPRKVLYETVVILILTFTAQFLWKDHRTLFVIAPMVYFFIERRIRRRTWKDVGFDLRSIPGDMAANGFLILLVSIIIQFLVVWVAKIRAPEFIDLVISRLPFAVDQTAHYLPVLLVAILCEEISYRALFQERLSWFIPAPLAIVTVSLMFGIAHFTRGNPVIVLVDILLVILDSVIYGIIFNRSKNIFVVWFAHFLADWFALTFIRFL